MIRIVRGNRFRLLIPLELTTTEGGVSKTEQDAIAVKVENNAKAICRHCRKWKK